MVDRTPPQDLAAEQSVLGAMLMSKDAIADVVEVLRGTDFYRPAHELVYDAVLDLYGRGEPADAITVAAELTRRGEIGRVGGAPYLHDLLASVSIAANAGYYAEIVREKAILRRLVDASIRIGQMSYAAEGDVDEIVDRAQAEVYSVTDKRTSEDYKSLSELMQPTMDEIEAIGSRGGQLAGVPTGFADLDELTNGMHAGQMIIIAARPGLGKALSVETPLPTPTGWTTMGEVRIGDRLVGADGRPTTVVGATDVMTDRECFEISFSDGTTVIADAHHEWQVTSRAGRRAAADRPVDCSDETVTRIVLLAMVARHEPEQYVGLPELLAETGEEFRNLLHAVGRQVGAAVAVPVAGSAADTRRVVYPRARMLVGLASCLTRDRSASRRVDHSAVYTTAELARAVRLADGRCNWAVACAAPIDGAPVDLPASAYELGVRLLERVGTHGVGHLPAGYLRASRGQRRDLLAGLVDAVGCVQADGRIRISLPDAGLADAVHELIVSLGHCCTRGRDAGHDRGTGRLMVHTLTFAADDDVFRVAHKAAEHRRRRAADPAAGRARYITAIRPVGSRPVRCVEVDSDDHLYLATRSMVPTHNSTLGLDLARAASIKHGLTSAIFSLEMSQIEIVMRLLSAEASVPLNHIRNGKMSDDDWQRIAKKMGDVAEAPLFIDDSPNLTMMEIRAKARRLRQRHELKLIIIDYLQLLTSGKKVESRQVEVSEFSRQLKLLAKELEVPVVALAQLNRGPETRGGDKKPMLSDLRESGSLEQDADMVILLNRPDIYDKESERAGEADFDVAKHRNGPTKTITVAFQGHYSRFIDMHH
ncbi:replicative DNA helicase [Microlunatus sp. Gsoil 973]|uniref:replicative DNA helicase n=1 Tax=Microlunatus sp. Gsoil 973 TaxID=2672569 RepID=UPI00210832AB|nr:replicative DNA helicase [Microlunatus sp. Gsoil 973]